MNKAGGCSSSQQPHLESLNHHIIKSWNLGFTECLHLRLPEPQNLKVTECRNRTTSPTHSSDRELRVVDGWNPRDRQCASLSSIPKAHKLPGDIDPNFLLLQMRKRSPENGLAQDYQSGSQAGSSSEPAIFRFWQLQNLSESHLRRLQLLLLFPSP